LACEDGSSIVGVNSTSGVFSSSYICATYAGMVDLRKDLTPLFYLLLDFNMF
jgi:hypothetical protein